MGDLILDLYEVLEILGAGAFGKVYKVLHRGWNILLAVKKLRFELKENTVNSLLISNAERPLSLLQYAVEKGHKDIVKLFIEKGADVNIKAKNKKILEVYKVIKLPLR